MNTKIRHCMIAFVLLISFGSVLAENIWCQTKVQNLYIDKYGAVLANLSVSSNYAQFCNVNTEWKGVSPITCIGWLSLIKSAVVRKADAKMMYDKAGVSDCAAIPAYANAPSPTYFMLMN